MNENEMFMPKPTIQKTEAVEKNTLKSSESDSDLSWDSKSIDTFDDLRKKPIPGISTFDDFKNEPKQGISTFDDLKGNKKKNEINTFDDLRKNTIEKPSEEKIVREQEESQPAYLQRAGEAVAKKIESTMGNLVDHARMQENDLPKDVHNMIESIMIEALKQQDSVVNQSKNEEIIKSIEKQIGYHGKSDLKDSASFDTTQRNRKFFETQPGKGAAKRETYWNTLFFKYNTAATKEFAKKIFDDKKIVLLGGGRSRLKEELRENGINPNEVVNVDPFVENPEVNSDPVIPISASDSNFIKKMHERGIDSADEILAEYSVPAYLEDPKEIQQLFQNIDALLADGGSARIWPIQVGGKGEETDLLARKNALLESLEKINATNKYEIALYKAAGRPGIILHKLMPTEAELQAIRDEKNIQEVRKKISQLS